jgi:co-chaperonin GroES (HSP10)
MQAIGKYLIIDIISEEIKTSSGLLLSGEDAKEFRYAKGKVVSPGTEVTTIKEGDIIFYDKVRSFTMIIDGGQKTIITLGDIVLIE